MTDALHNSTGHLWNLLGKKRRESSRTKIYKVSSVGRAKTEKHTAAWQPEQRVHFPQCTQLCNDTAELIEIVMEGLASILSAAWNCDRANFLNWACISELSKHFKTTCSLLSSFIRVNMSSSWHFSVTQIPKAHKLSSWQTLWQTTCRRRGNSKQSLVGFWEPRPESKTSYLVEPQTDALPRPHTPTET